MKKTLIALAIAGVSFNAAAVNLKDGSKVATYASEIALPAVLTDAAVGDNTLDVVFPLGFSATVGVKRYVRFDLTNAEFATKVDPANLTATTAGLLDENSISVGGAVGDKYVVIEITPKLAIPNDEKMNLALANIKALGGEATVQYRLYETGVDAVALDGKGNTNTLSSASGKLFGLKSGIVANVTSKGAVDKIDVAQQSKLFDRVLPADKDHTEIGTLTVGANIADKVLDKDGNAVTTLAALMASAKLEVAGDFSAGKKKESDGTLDATAVFTGIIAGNATVTASKAEFKLDPAVNYTGPLTFTVDGKTAIEKQDMTVKFVPVAKTGYNLNIRDLGVLGTLAKNGATAEANLLLAHDTSYTNLVRITNTSGIKGNLFITVIADDGKSVTFPLSDVAGQPAALAGGASTEQMNVSAIYDAAAAKGFVATGQKKMRLKVEGEVGDHGLSLQVYTVSKDGNALNTMNAFSNY